MSKIVIGRTVTYSIAAGLLTTILFGFKRSDEILPLKNPPVCFVASNDTVPSKKKEIFIEKNINTQGIEDAMKEVEYSMKRLKEELRKNNWDDAEGLYRKRLEEINWNKIQDESARALKEAQRRINAIDIKRQIDLANHLQLDVVKRNMELANLEMQKSQHQLQLAKVMAQDRAWQNARLGLLNAKSRLKSVKDFQKELESDGLIKKGEPFSLEIKDGKLYINDKKQSGKTLKKYKEKYGDLFEDGNKFRIQNDGKEEEPMDEGEVI
ncbi:MAG: hypothetical protein QM802_05525 [Agriterribacter sp.]